MFNAKVQSQFWLHRPLKLIGCFQIFGVISLQLLFVMAARTKWEAVKDRVTGSPAHDHDATLEANLENADPELCIRLLQVGLLTPSVCCRK